MPRNQYINCAPDQSFQNPLYEASNPAVPSVYMSMNHGRHSSAEDDSEPIYVEPQKPMLPEIRINTPSQSSKDKKPEKCNLCLKVFVGVLITVIIVGAISIGLLIGMSLWKKSSESQTNGNDVTISPLPTKPEGMATSLTSLTTKTNLVTKIPSLTSKLSSAPMFIVSTSHTAPSPTRKAITTSKDCQDILDVKGISKNGIYPINLDGQEIAVNCEFENNHGWLLLMRRKDDSVDFAQIWDSYKIGFGSQTNEFWIGNDIIHKLTTQKIVRLRIDMWNDNSYMFAEYDTFSIANEAGKYALHIKGFSGNATGGDRLGNHVLEDFSTIDKDNDRYNTMNCAREMGGGGGWWYGHCSGALLTGNYHLQPNAGYAGIAWNFDDVSQQLTRVEMKIRPKKQT